MAEPLLLLVLVVAGIAVLLFGGEVLVKGATALARRLGVPALLVGLTIVAFGTSAPEMVVSVLAAIEGAPGLAIGNIVGSNIANILFVLGFPAIIAPIATQAPGVRRNVAIALAATVIFIVLVIDGALSLLDGAILAGLIVAYVVYLALGAMMSRDDPALAELIEIDTDEGLPRTAVMTGAYVLLGLVLLPVGAQLIVEGASGIARAFGISEAVIGLTILAFGTSLPELATALMAAVRRQADMAIGNVVGSNIFNLFAVGGITGISAALATGSAAPIDAEFIRLDVWVMLASLVAAALLVFLRRPVSRPAGLVLAGAYVAYLAWLAVTNLPAGV